MWQLQEETIEEKPAYTPKGTNLYLFEEERVSNEEKIARQAKKYSNPANDPLRNALIYLTDMFGQYINNNDIQSIDQTLIDKDSELFLFNCREATHCKYSTPENQGFAYLLSELNIKQREVLETAVIVEKNIVSTISRYLLTENINNEENNTEAPLREKLAFEIFNIKDHKIVKYRAAFTFMTPEHEPDVFEPTKRERMLARIKEINYKLTETSNLGILGTLLDENTEYKFWSWDDQKSFILKRSCFDKNLEELQANKVVKRILPFELYTKGDTVIATYVYQLEDNTEGKDKKKYLWMSNCAYKFDADLKIEKVVQLGELYPEEEAIIPFESGTKETFIEGAKKFFSEKRPSFDVFYRNDVDFECIYNRFGPADIYHLGTFRVPKDVDKIHVFYKDEDYAFDWVKLVDAYVDHNDPSYDVMVAVVSTQFKELGEGMPHQGEYGNGVVFMKAYVENGKLVKINQFFTRVYEPIPSPYDDLTLSGKCIIPKK